MMYNPKCKEVKDRPKHQKGKVMKLYKVCFFSGETYYEQFFSTREAAEQAVANFNDVAVIEEYRV